MAPLRTRSFFAAVLAAVLSVPLPAAADEVRNIEFPVEAEVSFSDDFGDPRSGGRRHEGIDLLGKKMTPLLAAVDGRVRHLVIPEASWGYAIVLSDADGYRYHYLHVNNDSPGTDDGAGGTRYAYAPGIYEDAAVSAGALVGWMGDSGNAENVGPHLHFEIRRPDGTAINPYQSLQFARRSGRFDPQAEKASSPTINADRALTANAAVPVFCISHSLIKSTSSKAVYYCGADGRRYVFPNQKIFATWNGDFSAVQTITDAELAAVPLGKNVTYRPGTKLIKIQTDPKVYAVGRGGLLRWVTTPDIAVKLYGKDWTKLVEDVPDTFFTDYKVGDPITAA